MLSSSKIIFSTVLTVLFTFSAIGENPFPPFAEDQIKIDGDDSDWSGIEAFKEPFCGPKKGNDTIDVKSLHAGFTKTHFIYKMVLDPSPAAFSAKGSTSIMQIVYDSDNDKSTGASKDSLIYKLKAEGFERRVEISINNKKEITASLYSKENGFNKKIKDWKNGSGNLSVKGDVLELKVPYDLLAFKPESGPTKLRMYFAEFANSEGKLGYAPLSLTLDYSALKTVVAKNSSGTKSSDEKSDFNIYHLMLITIWIVSILCGFAIAPKAGLTTGIAALNLIPFLGQLVFLFILAFGQWPLHKDYHKLEDRLREFDDVI